MLKIKTSTRFEKELKRALKRGQDEEKVKEIMKKLVCQIPLDPKHRDHKLVGEFSDCRECHITPDWLLVYRLTDTHVSFERTGSHSDLFK
ncbi:MAG: type II toxin-antitoxin system YafQ family toxin [Myxococcaceae bacterium]